MSKGTKMKHANTIEFVLGPNVRLSDVDTCIKKIER